MTRDKLIKLIAGVILFVFITVFSINFFGAVIQNKVVSTLNSKKFEQFLVYRFNDLLEKIAEGDLTEEDVNYYSKILKKIIIKFDPVLKEINTND